MAWFDVEEGTFGWAWFDPQLDAIPYQCWLFEEKDQAEYHLDRCRYQDEDVARWIVVPAVADGKKYVPFDQASEALKEKVRDKIEQL